MSMHVNGAQTKEQISTMKSRKHYHYYLICRTIYSFSRVGKVGFLFLKQDVSFNHMYV